MYVYIYILNEANTMRKKNGYSPFFEIIPLCSRREFTYYNGKLGPAYCAVRLPCCLGRCCVLMNQSARFE